MPLLVMKSYPETLLDQSCRMAVRRQAEYAARAEGAVGDLRVRLQPQSIATATTSTRPSASPASGLKRGLGDELVVAPYATALAAMVEPQLAVRNLRRLSDDGRAGAYGYYEAIDYTHAAAGELGAGETSDPSDGTVVRAFMAHHQGMTLVSLANVLLGDPMVRRFHADPRVQATELLLQERVPRAGADHPAPAGRGDARGGPGARAGPAPLPLAAHAVAARPVPVERQLHHGRDERRAAAPASAAAASSPATARTRRATRAASSSTCGTCAAGRCGPRPTTRRDGSRTTTW